MTPPAITVECAECGAAAPQKPGVPADLLLAAAHVRADVPGRPCGVDRIHKATRFSSVMTSARIWECRELWDEFLAEEARLYSGELRYPGEYEEGVPEPIADPPGWTGDCRAEGVSW